ncbi:hypothetical protein SAMN05444392_104127 [Seinonella peptonophila]|uniref:Ig-like domain (Group 3) n=1 Tax=Seinonella peptonophila TaxID=112248 RepID=A0A1M4X556_9BACL|nr:hypothetical protein [Seinonella peptonophila]SHE88571.1 hypothetical protein SAMN05444392_104127 [Seinonella peptonophila]
MRKLSLLTIFALLFVAVLPYSTWAEEDNPTTQGTDNQLQPNQQPILKDPSAAHPGELDTKAKLKEYQLIIEQYLHNQKNLEKNYVLSSTWRGDKKSSILNQDASSAEVRTIPISEIDKDLTKNKLDVTYKKGIASPVSVGKNTVTIEKKAAIFDLQVKPNEDNLVVTAKHKTRPGDWSFTITGKKKIIINKANLQETSFIVKKDQLFDANDKKNLNFTVKATYLGVGVTNQISQSSNTINADLISLYTNTQEKKSLFPAKTEETPKNPDPKDPNPKDPKDPKDPQTPKELTVPIKISKKVNAAGDFVITTKLDDKGKEATGTWDFLFGNQQVTKTDKSSTTFTIKKKDIKAGKYDLTITFKGKQGNQTVTAKYQLTITIQDDQTSPNEKSDINVSVSAGEDQKLYVKGKLNNATSADGTWTVRVGTKEQVQSTKKAEVALTFADVMNKDQSMPIKIEFKGKVDGKDKTVHYVGKLVPLLVTTTEQKNGDFTVTAKTGGTEKPVGAFLFYLGSKSKTVSEGKNQATVTFKKNELPSGSTKLSVLFRGKSKSEILPLIKEESFSDQKLELNATIKAEIKGQQQETDQTETQNKDEQQVEKKFKGDEGQLNDDQLPKVQPLGSIEQNSDLQLNRSNLTLNQHSFILLNDQKQEKPKEEKPKEKPKKPKEKPKKKPNITICPPQIKTIEYLGAYMKKVEFKTPTPPNDQGGKVAGGDKTGDTTKPPSDQGGKVAGGDKTGDTTKPPSDQGGKVAGGDKTGDTTKPPSGSAVGGPLPKTASTLPTSLLYGLLLLLIGGASLVWAARREAKGK